jgi:AcrR family transcriptional regulator
MSATDTVAAPVSTRDAIVIAAWACFQRVGPRKTTITDISREAGVARGTVYQHFPDKAAILRATAERASEAFYAALSTAMAPGATLDEQFSLAAAFMVRSKQELRAWGEVFDGEQVALLLTAHAEVLLADCIDFLHPFVLAARARGEVREDIDVAAAAEWLARMLFSLYTTASPRRDLDDPEAVRSFVGAFAVAGLRGPILDARPPLPFGLGHIADVLGAS